MQAGQFRLLQLQGALSQQVDRPGVKCESEVRFVEVSTQTAPETENARPSWLRESAQSTGHDPSQFNAGSGEVVVIRDGMVELDLDRPTEVGSDPDDHFSYLDLGGPMPRYRAFAIGESAESSRPEEDDDDPCNAATSP